MLRLNFCVRYGNRWIPQAIVTGNCLCFSFAPALSLRLRFSRTFKTAQVPGRAPLASASLLSGSAFASPSSPLRSRSLLRFPFRNSRHFSFADPQSSLPLSPSWLSDQALGRLVSPSFTRYRASTDDLSTWSSPRGLTRLRDGNSLLWVGFTLRCLQRLSSPHFASQLCRWHDNCCTRGASIPVLSY